MELNELQWWSNWSDATLYGENSYLLHSDCFNEYFFNRAGFLDCEAKTAEVAAIEREFANRALAPHFVVPESCNEVIASLKRSGYTSLDKMAVMMLGGPKFKTGQGVAAKRIDAGGIDGWCRTYLLSFYGETALLPYVSGIAGRLVDKREVALLAGMVGNETAGVVATFQSGGLVGVYCVGTLPKFRRMGVASALLEAANGLARSSGSRLILQTLISDSAEDFYVAGGFKRIYIKDVLRKEASSFTSASGGR